MGAPVNASWQYPVTNYTRHTYQAATQNWMLEQHDNGWIYIANNKGLLEFDGMNWHTYSVRNAKLRAVKKGNDGRIYVGGISQFGYFEPDNLGGLRYQELSDSLLSIFNIGVVRNILVDGAQVYFQADRYIYLPRGRRIEYIDYKNQISASTLFKRRLYVASDEGLFVLNGRNFMPAIKKDSARALNIVAMLPYKENLILLTRSEGIFIFDGFSVRKLITAAEDFLLHKQIFTACLHGSLLAVGSAQDGVCLLDLETGAVKKFSINYGLQNKTVHGLLFDAGGNLWLALDNGIDCIHLSSCLSSLHGGSSQIGSGYASSYYQGFLYLGTNQGVYRTAFPDVPEAETPMEFVRGTEGQVWSFLPYDGKLFCASDDGVFLIGGGRSEKVGDIKGVRCIVSLPNRNDVLIAGTYGVNRGLYLLMKQQGRWKVITKIADCDISCKSLLAESSTFLWMANKGRGVYRLLLSDDLHRVRQQKKYNKFPTSYDAQLTWMRNEITVASHYGLWRFDQTKDSLVEYREMEQLLNGKASYTYISEDEAGNIWYAEGGLLKLLRYKKEQKTYSHRPECFLKGALIENFESVSVVGASAIISTEDGFSKLELSSVEVEKSRPSLQIRRIYLTGRRDSLIYGRSYRYDDEVVVAIPYAHNSLRIEYNMSGYGSSQAMLFSYRLSSDNKEGHWSEYSEKSMKEFTALHEGTYTFSVRSLPDAMGEQSVTSFTFKILPPWYRTWWSYMAYVLAIVLLMFYTYRRIMSSRRHLLMQKELELHRQKQAFEKVSEQKDRTINSLKEENLQAELRHKSEELVCTTLNIVRKNEMLLEFKKGVDGIAHSLNEDDLVSLRRRIVRLQGQIATNIEHDNDLQVFQTTFDSVHHNFFKKLGEAYPDLSNKEKLLCAYIQMNLLTKEIAPLLNISVRGVEISRYRLRKKLGLEERDNLTEFLKKFSN